MGTLTRRLASMALLLGLMASSPARADFTLYGITFGLPPATPGQLITINTTTGSGTAVGTLDSPMASYGLAALNGNLYTYDQVASPNLVLQIDPTTGHTLGSTDIGTGVLIGEGDIAFRSDGTGFLYGDGSKFFSFDLAAGTSTLINTGSFLFDGLAFSGGGVLFGLSQGFGAPNGQSSLYTINTTTGAVSLVGALNVPAAATELLGGLAFAPDGTLYAELSDGTTSSTLYTVSTTTGQATLVGSIGFGNVSGIRFLETSSAAVPEPSSLALCGIAGAVGLGYGWRRRRRDVA
jgi:hypothetical protein